MKTVKGHIIDRHRCKTWVRYHPGKQNKSRDHGLAAAQCRSLIRALDHVDLTKRSETGRQYNSARRQLHENRYERYRLEKDQIIENLQDHIRSNLEKLKIELDENQNEIQVTLTRLTDNILFEMRFEEFEFIWKHVSSLYEDRSRTISESDSCIESLFADAVTEIKDTTTAAMKQMIEIAFQLRPEIEYLFYQELAPINETLIDMKVTLYEFRCRLRIADIRLQEGQLIVYNERRRVWRLQQHNRAINQLKDKFRSAEYSNPEWRQRTIANLQNCDQRLGVSIEYLITGLGKLVPPILSNVKVMQVHSEMKYVLQTAGQISSQCIQDFMDSLKNMDDQMMQDVAKLEAELNQYAAYEQAQIADQIQSEISVITNSYREAFTKDIDKIALQLQAQERLLNERLDAVIKFYQHAARTWENCLKLLDDLELDTSEAWMRRHDLYDDELQSYESEIKSITEGLRRASTEIILNENFQNVNLILGSSGTIETCHRNFLQESLSIAKGHIPNLEKLFRKIHSDVKALLELNVNDTDTELHLNDATEIQIWASKILSDQSVTVNSECSNSEIIPKQEAIPEPLVQPAELGTVEQVFLSICQYKFNMPLFCAMLSDLRSTFVTQISEICIHERERSRLQMDYRVQELTTLIDKNLRTLAPRIIQLETDVVQVRASELRENMKRFQRFWERYDQTFSNGDALSKSESALIEKCISDRTSEIDRIKDLAVKTQSMQKLQELHLKSFSLSNSFKTRIEKQMKSVKQLQDDLQTQLTQLRQQFLSSCVVFGAETCIGTATYHPDELAKYAAEVEILKSNSDQILMEKANYLQQIREKIDSVMSDEHLDEFLRKRKSELNIRKTQN